MNEVVDVDLPEIAGNIIRSYRGELLTRLRRLTYLKSTDQDFLITCFHVCPKLLSPSRLLEDVGVLM